MSEAADLALARDALKNGASQEQRLRAARQLASSVDVESYEALIKVAQDPASPIELRHEAGRSLAVICARRRRDLDDVVMANLTEQAYLAYDAEIARVLRQDPSLKMVRGHVGSGL